MYQFVDDAWTYHSTLLASDGAGGDLFGVGIRGYGSTAVVGAYGDSAPGGGSDAGA